MYDWVGGRTSELSAVGLLPAALQGLDIDGLLAGAAACDEATRGRDLKTNPAALMALMWHHATGGKGQKDMVVLPYKDRLLLFSRYLQQLVMESIGKQLDLKGNRVEQGLAVYGNKGSTDQHAYVQQLREGVPNFFAVFIRVLEDGGSAREVEPGVTAGDYLHGFLLGTRAALFENDRESMTITVPRVDARTVGALIALFERAVGLYAEPGRRQRLPPAGRRGREEGGRVGAGPASEGARGPVRRSADGRPDRRRQPGAPDDGRDGLTCSWNTWRPTAGLGSRTRSPGPSAESRKEAGDDHRRTEPTSTSSASTRSARCRWTRSRRPTPGTPGRRWAWPRSRTACGSSSCGSTRRTRSGRTATGSSSRPATPRCCCTRCCT